MCATPEPPQVVIDRRVCVATPPDPKGADLVLLVTRVEAAGVDGDGKPKYAPTIYDLDIIAAELAKARSYGRKVYEACKVTP